ncbi:MAG: peptidoglycan bridge formation glycyltransferase FemA/FemB family protein [Candidatus Pacebacteria bacterium]|nr:peptidoglycan bridge formation glycyltransferase FemA/FemB family protein [Candidatus Paceibacterota bacterium]
MDLSISEISDKNTWEEFLAGIKEKTFLQSWNWGEFQKKMGNSTQGGSASGGKIWRLGIYEERNLIAAILVSKVVAKRGIFLLLQHGPNVKNERSNIKNQIMAVLLGKLKEIGKEEKVDFIRIAPLFDDSKENLKIFQDLGFHKSPMHANAYEATWKLDISVSAEEILKNMRKTTRYLIRQAEKNPEISIETSINFRDLNLYFDLNRQVAKRQNFTPFSEEYIKNEFNSFINDNEVLLLFGKYKNELAAAAMVIFWQGIGFYHQAASLSKFAKLSIPYLLQWEAIKEAKKRGCILYDFWGFTDPEKYPKHPWAGPTLFKMGFGGFAKEHIKTQDFPLSKKYCLIYIFEQIRKIKRGF